VLRDFRKAEELSIPITLIVLLLAFGALVAAALPVKQRAPLVFGFVLAFAFVLLLVAFRSLVIAAKTIVLNLMSVAAAYGVLVLVFQHGWGTSLLDYPGTNSIAAWLPLFLFVLLFGLSMDYHVFILSRVREAHEQGRTTEEAVEQASP